MAIKLYLIYYLYSALKVGVVQYQNDPEMNKSNSSNKGTSTKEKGKQWFSRSQTKPTATSCTPSTITNDATNVVIAGTNFTSIDDFGINLGFGLPMPRQISSLNLGFEYGQKGTIDNNLIKENYFNIRLSLSLNSTNWFKKRQID